MNYSVYASVTDAVKSINEPIDWDKLEHEFSSSRWQISCMHSEWNEITNGGSFYGNGTKTVTDAFFGEHSYDAKLTANVESQFETERFYKKKFRFQTRQTSGCRVDIPRYLNGDQRYWFAIRKIKVENKAVRVFAPMGGLYGVSASEMRVCGALTCAVVEALESQGISVELWASCCCSHVFAVRDGITPEESKIVKGDPDYRNICELMKIKDSSQYCDYGMINYVTGNDGFYRNIVFKDRILTGVKSLGKGIVWSASGSSYNFSRDLIPPDEDYDPKNDIVIPRIYNMDEAKHWLENSFNTAVKCGVNAEPTEGEED